MNQLLIIIGLILAVAGCENAAIAPNETGIIEGQVEIGPLCGNIPVQTEGSNPCGFSDAMLDTIYGKYKVEIKETDNGKVVAKPVVLDHTGLFSFKVPVGSYNVEVVLPEGAIAQNTLTGGISGNKKMIKIASNEVVKITLNVDTGIR